MWVKENRKNKEINNFYNNKIRRKISTWAKRRGRRDMHVGKKELGIKTKTKIQIIIENACTWVKRRGGIK